MSPSYCSYWKQEVGLWFNHFHSETLKLVLSFPDCFITFLPWRELWDWWISSQRISQCSSSPEPISDTFTKHKSLTYFVKIAIWHINQQQFVPQTVWSWKNNGLSDVFCFPQDSLEESNRVALLHKWLKLKNAILLVDVQGCDSL